METRARRRRAARTKPWRLKWNVTPWTPYSDGHGWVSQPIILVEGRKPFFADHPAAYVAELERLHGDELLIRGNFYRLIGEFKDELDRVDWGPWDG